MNSLRLSSHVFCGTKFSSLFLLLVLLTFPKIAYSDDEWLYTVQQDDNLWNLSEEYLSGYEDWPRLRELNNISDPRKLPPGSILRFPIAWLKKQSVQVKVATVFGDVTVSHQQNTSFEPLTTDMLLAPPAEVRTNANANAIFEFEDGSRLQLNENSVLRIKTLNTYGSSGVRDTQLGLPQGRVENKVEPKENSGTRFEIITPAAVTGVRGTRYRVTADKQSDQTRVEVVEGNVAVASGGSEVEVPSGFATIAVTGQKPLTPTPLPGVPDISGVPDAFSGAISFTLPLAAGIEGFRVQIRAADNSDLQLIDSTFSGSEITVSNLEAGDYLLSVRAIDKQGIEGLSAAKVVSLEAEENLLIKLLFLTICVLVVI